MFSLQKLLGKDDRFFTLLEASAEEARHSVQSLTKLLKAPKAVGGLGDLHDAKEADKKITTQINEALVNTFVSQLEREDIEVLSAALYRIPKTVEKIAERIVISSAVLEGASFSRHIELMDQATQLVVQLVKLLRNIGSGQLEQAKKLNAELQKVEGDADKLILEILKDLYSGRYEAIQVLARKDLYELLEKVIDRCRDAGNVVTHIVLKNA